MTVDPETMRVARLGIPGQITIQDELADLRVAPPNADCDPGDCTDE